MSVRIEVPVVVPAAKLVGLKEQDRPSGTGAGQVSTTAAGRDPPLVVSVTVAVAELSALIVIGEGLIAIENGSV